MGLEALKASHTPMVCIIPLLSASEAEVLLRSSVSVYTIETRPGMSSSSRTPGNSAAISRWLPEPVSISPSKSFSTGSRPRFPLLFHSLVCIENNLFIVGIGPILNNNNNLEN